MKNKALHSTGGKKKRRFFIPQMLNSRINKKKMQKEVIGVIAADKELRGEHGWCLGHCKSVFHLLQVNQKLIKYLLFRVRKNSLHTGVLWAGRLCTCGRHCPSSHKSFEHRHLPTQSHRQNFKKAIGRLLQQAISKKHSFLVRLLG